MIVRFFKITVTTLFSFKRFATFLSAVLLSSPLYSAPEVYLLLGGTPPKKFVVADLDLPEAYLFERLDSLSGGKSTDEKSTPYRVSRFDLSRRKTLQTAYCKIPLDLGGETPAVRDENLIHFFLTLNQFSQSGTLVSPEDILLRAFEAFEQKGGIRSQKNNRFYSDSRLGFSWGLTGASLIALQLALLNFVTFQPSYLKFLPSPFNGSLSSALVWIFFLYPVHSNTLTYWIYHRFPLKPKTPRGAFLQGFSMGVGVVICGQILTRLVTL